MKNQRFFLLSIVGLLSFQSVFGQLSFSHEVGVIAGPVAFQGDFGQRSDFDNFKGNIGIGVGLIHYINFAYRADCNCYSKDTYWNDHFKLRSELLYHRTKMNHFGEWAVRDSDEGFDLRDHSGVASVVELGLHLEYFPLSIRDFSAGSHSLSPFISFGADYVFFNPVAESAQGGIGATETTYDNFLIGDGEFGGIDTNPATTWALVGVAGTRYKFSYNSDLMLNVRWHYYLSDWVEGLNPDPVVQPSNMFNDWAFFINVGYIRYLD